MNLEFNKSVIQGVLLSLLINANILYVFFLPPGLINAVITIMLFSVSASNFRFSSNAKISVIQFLLFFIFGYGAISLAIAPSLYSLLIFLKSLTILIICIIATKLNKKSIEIFLNTTVILNLILAIISISNIHFIYSNSTINYLTVTYALGASFVISLIQSVLSNRRKVLWVLSTIILLIAILQYPSRGTLIFSLFSCIIFLLHRSRNSIRTKIAVLLFLASFSIGVVWVWNHLLINTYMGYRFIELFTSMENEPRIDLYRSVIGAIKDNWLFGVGIGNSGIVSLGKQDAYPHNVFLEAWLEYGIFGLFCFITLTLWLFRKSIKASHVSHYGIILLYLFVYGFLNFQKSFSLKYSHFYLLFPCLSIAILKIYTINECLCNNNNKK